MDLSLLKSDIANHLSCKVIKRANIETAFLTIRPASGSYIKLFVATV